MPQHTKIATCCYCGNRAALVLRGQERHELACAACGAPLHDLKMLPKARTADRSGKSTGKRPVQKTYGPATPAPVWERKAHKSRKKKKKRKGLARRFLEEAFDVIEDIFD